MADEGFDNGIEIGHITKNASQRVTARLTTFKSYDLLDLRVHYDAGTEYKPTGKGFAIRRESIPELIDLLQQAQERAGQIPAEG